MRADNDAAAVPRASGSLPGDLFAELGAALRYAVAHVDSWLSLSVLSLLVAALEQLGALPVPAAGAAIPLARVLTGAYFYLVLRKAALGSRRLPRLRDYRDSWETLIYPLLQGAAVALWFVGPLLASVAATIGLTDFAERLAFDPVALFREPRALLYALLAFELIYLPPALLATCARCSPLQLLDPSRGLHLALALGRSYRVAFAALCVLVAAAFLASSLGALLMQAIPIPIVTAVLGHLLVFSLALAQARLLGELAARA